MPVKIGPYCINVTDLDRSIRFYEGVIGLSVLRRVKYHGLHEVILVAPGGGGKLQLAFKDDLRGPIEHGNALRKIYFDVDDCTAVHQRAVDSGSSSVQAPQRLEDYPVTFAMVSDPDGYVVELIEKRSPDRSSQ